MALAGAILLAEDDLALDHARGDTEAAQLGLQGMAQGHVVLGGYLAARAVDVAGGDGEAAGRDGAGARKVGRRHVGQVLLQRRRVPVSQQQAHVARHVLGQLVQAIGGSLFGGATQRPGHQGSLAEEYAVRKE